MELSLDLCLAYVPKTVSDFLTEVSGVRDVSEKMVRLEGYVTRLEDEMRKIDAFKRELPLCMLLLNDAIVRLKEEAMQCTESRNRAVLEEFLPLKENSGEDNAGKEKKKNWISSALLFGRTDTSCQIKKHGSVLELNLGSEKENRPATEKPIRLYSYGNRGGGAFVPFRTTVSEDSEVSKVPALCLATPLPESTPCDKKPPKIGGDAGSGSLVFAEKLKLQSKPQPQGSRKQRRCWSPELHRRFVDALQRLGGWKVATPKQIREIMQVDGLTNDEVKSHLQKYRLHIRKLPGSVTCPENGSWMDEEQSEEVNNSQSGSPQGPLMGGISAKAISSNDSLEAEEDDKSECHSWKGEVTV